MIQHSLLVACLALLASGTAAHGFCTPSHAERKEAGTVLIANLESGVSPEEARAAIAELAPADRWEVVETSDLPPGDHRPRFSILRIRQEGVVHAGVTGTIELEFFNERLMLVKFYPAELKPYLTNMATKLGTSVDAPGQETRAGRVIARFSRRTEMMVAMDFQDRVFVSYRDPQLLAEEEAWLRKFS